MPIIPPAFPRNALANGKHPPWAMTGFQICSIGSTMIDGNLARLDQFGGTFHDLENPVAAP
jgi:hypothetical protein